MRLFTAETDSELLYVTSRPIFHHYSQAVREMMMELAVQVQAKDGYTHDHCQRIMKASIKIGEAMGLDDQSLYRLNLGGFLHDVGKVQVPDAILNKAGALTNEEWVIMRQHPTFGRKMMEATSLPNLREAACVVEAHHERWDGKGYPLGLKEYQIPVESAIVAVVDAYDAMTTDRPYRNGMPKADALAEIQRGRGTQFRPDVVDVFLRIADE